MKKLSLLSFFALIFFGAYAQDPLFLNANQSLISLNPSFAGSNGLIRSQSAYQDQSPSLSSGYKSYVSSFDAYLKPLKGGLAISVLGDNYLNGLIKNQVISLAYAQYFSLMDGKLKIIPSLQGSYTQKVIDKNLLFFTTPLLLSTNSGTMFPQINPDADYGQTKTYLDLTSGILVNYKDKLYAGASVFHLNQPNDGVLGDYKLPYLLNLHISYNMILSEQSRIQFFYRHQQQQSYASNQFAVNLVSFNHLVTGLGCLNLNTPFISAGYRNNYFSTLLGYSLNTSKLSGSASGSWQVNASFNLRNKARRKIMSSFESW